MRVGWLVLSALIWPMALSAGATGLDIQSFDGSGELTFNEISSAAGYRVEWRTNMFSGLWSTGAPGVDAIGPSGLGTVSCTVDVSAANCFYRVVASTTNGLPPPSDYLVIDLSGGPTASNYPVSSLDSVPTGGWSDEYKTTKLVLRYIPAGTFVMGSSTGELGRSTWFDESQHQVTLTQGFYMGVFEVSQKQWERVVGTWPSYFTNVTCRDSRPVEKVSYAAIRGSNAGAEWPTNNNVDADSFMGRLQARTGRAFDLPTESQWEYAGRAGTTTALNSGYNLTNVFSDARMDDVGRYWCNGGSEYTQEGDTAVGTAKIGSYLVNNWGLYDIHGNVWEWCLDWYGVYPGTVTDPRGPSSRSHRALHGGGWYDPGAEYSRVASRAYFLPTNVFYSVGFRTCLPSVPVLPTP